MGAKSKKKSAREELMLFRMFKNAGLFVQRIAHQGGRRLADGDEGGDLSVKLLGKWRRFESKIKARGGGLKGLYGWLANTDGVIIRMDGYQPVVAMPFELFLEIAAKAEGHEAIAALATEHNGADTAPPACADPFPPSWRQTDGRASA
jgi:hypothetical protein